MSLYGMMRTGVSGMAAQSTRLGTVADNIANSGTNGYKRASVEFSSLVIPNSGSSYTSGGVASTIRYAISESGNLQYTTSATDLAIKDDGFFVVQNASGQPFLTRFGSFVPDAQGRLVNAAGFYLMGYNYENGIPSPVANGYAGLEEVRVSGQSLQAAPSSSGLFRANLPYGADIWTGTDLSTNPTADPVPGLNDAMEGESVIKSSLTVYDNVGQEVLIDLYFEKTSTTDWNVTAYYQPNASATNSFPYSQPPIGTATLQFDPTTGRLAGASATQLDIDLTALNGQTIALDLSEMTQLGNGYALDEAQVNGNAPSAIEEISFSSDGTMLAKYANGATKALYRVPFATVQSPDQLQVLPGNVYSAGLESGNVQIGFPNEGTKGSLVSGAVENSNVDIAQELTAMIESQRNYTANSKVFQTGSDLMDVLVNLKR